MVIEADIIVSIYEPLPESIGYGGFYFKQIFDKRGNIEFEILGKVFQEIYGKQLSPSPEGVGPFVTIEELQRFAFKVCQELEFKGIYIIPIEGFALMLERAEKVSDLWQEIINSEFLLKNPEKDRGVWKKIFS